MKVGVLILLTAFFLRIAAGYDFGWIHWDVPNPSPFNTNSMVLNIYSNTNLIYTSADTNAVLSKIVETWPLTEEFQKGVQMRMVDLLPVDQAHMPPLKSWPLFASVPIDSNSISIIMTEQRRFFISASSNIILRLEGPFTTK